MQEVINNREQTCNWYGIDLARDSFEEVDRKVGEHQGMLRRANGCRSLTDVGWSVEGALVRRPRARGEAPHARAARARGGHAPRLPALSPALSTR